VATGSATDLGQRGGRRKRRNKNNEDIIEEEIALPNRPLSAAQSAFWTHVNQYLCNITDVELELLAQQPFRPTDPALEIPALGVHYLEQWQQEDDALRVAIAADAALLPDTDASALGPPVKRRKGKKGAASTAAASPSVLSSASSSSSSSCSSSSTSSGTELSAAATTKTPQVGELHRRILAALVEEQVIPASNHKNDIYRLLLTPQTQQAWKEGENQDLQPGDLPLSQAPANGFDASSSGTLEDRIREELRGIGLLGPEESDPLGPLVNRQDDEVCGELRKMQRMLRDQVKTNNAMRAQLYQRALQRRSVQKWEQQSLAMLQRVEMLFYKHLKRHKRRIGKKRP